MILKFFLEKLIRKIKDKYGTKVYIKLSKLVIELKQIRKIIIRLKGFCSFKFKRIYRLIKGIRFLIPSKEGKLLKFTTLFL